MLASAGTLQGDRGRLLGADHLLDDRLAQDVVGLERDDLDLGDDATDLLERGDRRSLDLDLEALRDKGILRQRGKLQLACVSVLLSVGS